MGQQLSWVRDECLQQRPLGRSKSKRLTVPARLGALEVDLELAELEHRTRRGRRLDAPERGADPGEQLVDRERLVHVVVGARVERPDLVVARVAHGEHDDRYVGPTAEPPDHLDPVDVRQTEIEDEEIRLVLRK